MYDGPELRFINQDQPPFRGIPEVEDAAREHALRAARFVEQATEDLLARNGVTYSDVRDRSLWLLTEVRQGDRRTLYLASIVDKVELEVKPLEVRYVR